jgi:hypothetical protein
MCDDVKAFMDEMKEKEIECSPIHEERWGSLTMVALPGGGKIGVYQPKHGRPAATHAPKRAKKAIRKKPSRKR